MKLIELLTEIRDSDIWSPTKDDYNNREIGEPMKLAQAYKLIEDYGTRSKNYKLTDRGYKVIEAKGDLSILDKTEFSIQSTNNHISDNYGEYHQSASKDINTKNPQAKTDKKNIKNKSIGVICKILGGLPQWINKMFS